MLIKHEYNNLTWYNLSIFTPHPELKHGVFTRFGGISGPEGRDLSLAFNDVDSSENVLVNIKKAASALKLPWPAFVRQTHSDRIVSIKPSDNYYPQKPEDVYYNYDAVLAPEPGVNLLIKLADCQGVILYDPITKAVGLVHSGWRGSVQNIIGKTAAEMKKLGSNPANIKAGISPSLGPCCAEFINYREQLPDHFQDFMIKDNYFDFWAISRQQLTNAGLRDENIQTAGICTKCSSEFFSYRKGDKWGRFGIMAGVV